MAKELRTLGELRDAIKNHPCYVQPRFGVSERYVPITKAAARALLQGFPRNATPRDLEMFTDVFGTIEDDGTLTIG